MCFSNLYRLTASCFRHIMMYPRGDKFSTRSVSLYLYPHSSDELPPESGKMGMIEFTLTILNQMYGESYNYKRQGSPLHDSLLVIVDIIWNQVIYSSSCR
jgi:hypothetical protein